MPNWNWAAADTRKNFSNPSYVWCILNIASILVCNWIWGQKKTLPSVRDCRQKQQSHTCAFFFLQGLQLSLPSPCSVFVGGYQEGGKWKVTSMSSVTSVSSQRFVNLHKPSLSGLPFQERPGLWLFKVWFVLCHFLTLPQFLWVWGFLLLFFVGFFKKFSNICFAAHIRFLVLNFDLFRK